MGDDNVTCVPEDLFLHVTRSLDNGIARGMLLEIKYKNDPDIFWIASITMVCGPLLRVRYIGSESDFWCDLEKMEVHPLGWCRHFEGIIEPPDEISDRHGDNIVTLMKDMVTNGTTVPNESLISTGATAIERIKFGMKLEIQSENNPYKFWIATIVENVGGRLLLRYDAPDDVFEEFWIFYLDSRIRPVGNTKSKGPPYQLQHPENSQNIMFNEHEWDSCLLSSLEESQEYPFPNEILIEYPKPLFHRFESGMKLEALNPSNMSDIRPATVTQVFDNFYFLVVLDDNLNDCNNDGGYWLCNIKHPYIFPVGWAKANGIKFIPPISWDKKKEFDWNEYLKIESAIAAPSKYFKKSPDASKAGYEEGMKLEAVNLLNPASISSATIVKMTKHLLYILSDSTKNQCWFHYESLSLFPTNWCTSNNLSLEKPNKMITNEKFIHPLQTKNKEEWCDKIYFNYKCYSGPFISKNKLSQLPKSVGPGPLFLVIREVLNMIISVAYKPAKLLKDWEHEGKLEPGLKLEVLKAKLKTSTYHANVVIVTKNEEISGFCKEMCAKLQACPLLFGPQQYNDQCPERCLQVDKTKFRNFGILDIVSSDKRGRPKGSISKSSVPKCWNTNKKRKRRGLHFMTIRARERRAAQESGNKDAESGNESDPSPCSTPQQSETGTRPNSPDSNSDGANKKQRKKREPRTNIPPLEMKTRGAKLPNFALQIKQGHWDKKDVETIYNNTCVVPKKPYLSDSESESDSTTSNSLELKRRGGISDVSDSEEPELKKLRVTPLHDPQPTDIKMFHCGNNGSTSSASVASSHQKTDLPSNPQDWTINDLYSYLIKYDECKEIAVKLREEEVDGAAFIMLNFPTMCQHLKMRMKPAMNLCKHVASLKWAFISRYVNLNCDA